MPAEIISITAKRQTRAEMPREARRQDALARMEDLKAELSELDGQIYWAEEHRREAAKHRARRDQMQADHTTRQQLQQAVQPTFMLRQDMTDAERATVLASPFSPPFASPTRGWIDSLPADRRASALVPSCGTSETGGDAA